MITQRLNRFGFKPEVIRHDIFSLKNQNSIFKGWRDYICIIVFNACASMEDGGFTQFPVLGVLESYHLRLFYGEE